MTHMSYGNIMEDFGTTWKMTDTPLTLSSSDDKYRGHTLNTVFEELEAPVLSSSPSKPEPKKVRVPESKIQTLKRPPEEN